MSPVRLGLKTQRGMLLRVAEEEDSAFFHVGVFSRVTVRTCFVLAAFVTVCSVQSLAASQPTVMAEHCRQKKRTPAVCIYLYLFVPMYVKTRDRRQAD